MENQNLPLIKEIIIPNPPTKYTINYKKPKFDKDGKLIEKMDFYLTGNLFYADRTSYHITSNIVQDCKLFIKEHLIGLPELEKLRIEIEYHTTKVIDLDNKLSFWLKIMLDVLKKPTARQLENAAKRKKVIVTTNTIDDDNSKFIDEIKMSCKRGEHAMVVRLYGRVKADQMQMNLY